MATWWVKVQAFLFAFLALACSGAEGGTLFTINRAEGDYFLASIDTRTLEFRIIGRLIADFHGGGLAWDPDSSTLYMVTTTNNYLWTISTETGRADIIREYKPQYVDLDLVGLAFDCKNQTLWATGYRRGFYSIAPGDATLEEKYFGPWPGEHFGDDKMHGLAYNYRQDSLVSFRYYWTDLASGAGILFRLNWREGKGKDILADFDTPPDAHGLAYDPDMNLYWLVNEAGDLFSLNPVTGFKKTLRATGLGRLDGLVYAHNHSCEQRPFQINYGLTDAWLDTAFPGQGVFINVFPHSRTMFVGWFTFDLEGFIAADPITLGAGEHRWLTAQGRYHDDFADLELFLTKGGLFNLGQPRPGTTPYGSLYVEFEDCESAVMRFSVPQGHIEGETNLSRASNQRVELCREIEFRTPEE